MAVDAVQTQTKVDDYGNSYTTKISNDNLTNEDFLTLLLEEMKHQDPTSPMDSNRMLDTQMQMSNIQTNLELAKSMESLQASYSLSALSTAANVIGKNIEDGNISDQGINKAYTVRSVENTDGEVFVRAQEILFLEDQVLDQDGKLVNYDINGNILDSAGNATGNYIALLNPGEVIRDSDNKPIILDSEGEGVPQTDDYSFEMAGSVQAVYSDQLITIPFTSVTKIF
ncbi:MAG: flagellar biosynthesis protein FlgD [Arcobacter sp.]|nr:MAG: flagellar biosynthesis protein FlgD [Arcobacter sp.]